MGQLDAWDNVAVGYVIVIGSIIAYSAWVLVRGRRLSKQVPAEDRRWL
jgi:hypothetical protein